MTLGVGAGVRALAGGPVGSQHELVGEAFPASGAPLHHNAVVDRADVLLVLPGVLKSKSFVGHGASV